MFLMKTLYFATVLFASFSSVHAYAQPKSEAIGIKLNYSSGQIVGRLSIAVDAMQRIYLQQNTTSAEQIENLKTSMDDLAHAVRKVQVLDKVNLAMAETDLVVQRGILKTLPGRKQIVQLMGVATVLIAALEAQSYYIDQSSHSLGAAFFATGATATALAGGWLFIKREERRATRLPSVEYRETSWNNFWAGYAEATGRPALTSAQDRVNELGRMFQKSETAYLNAKKLQCQSLLSESGLKKVRHLN